MQQIKTLFSSATARIIVVMMGGALVLTAGLWPHFNTLPVAQDPDALQQLSFAHSLYDAVRTHAQYPLWNPYFGGGVRWAGYIYNPGLSPIGLIYVLFGETVGIFVWIWTLLMLGGWGMYASCRRWVRLDEGAALFGGVLYMVSFWLPGRLQDGNYDELALYLLPFMLACLYDLLHRRWLGWLLPIAYVTTFAQAKYAAFIIGFALLLFGVGALLAASAGAPRLSWRRFALGWGVAFVVGGVLALPKLLPLLDLIALDLVPQDVYHADRGYTVRGLLIEMVRFPAEASGRYQWKGVIGVGWLAGILALVGLVVGKWRAVGAGVLLGGGAFISLGPHAPLPFTRLVAHLPLFNSMRNYAKYWNILIVAGVCLLAAVGFAALVAWGQRKFGRNRPLTLAIPLFLAVVALAQPSFYAVRLYGHLFGMAPAVERENPDYYNVASEDLIGVRDRYRYPPGLTLEQSQYNNIRNDIGTLTWYGNFVFAEHTVPRYIFDREHNQTDNPDYLGELYCLPACTVLADVAVAYNTLSAEVTHTGATQLVFNQNYDLGWRSNVGEVVEYNGLVSVMLTAADVSPTQVTLRFTDTRFWLGFWLALFTLLVWTAGYYRYANR